MVINHGDSSSCYLTSPYVNYVGYAKDFILSLNDGWIRRLLLFLLVVVSTIIPQNHLDRVVYVNHWLIATGPQFCLSSEQFNKLLLVLKERFSSMLLFSKALEKVS